jgi:hypothetical protein
LPRRQRLRMSKFERVLSMTDEHEVISIEPWHLAGWSDENDPNEVDGAWLLSAVSSLVAKHIVLSKEAAIAIALWVVAAWLTEIVDTAPRLLIKSPDKRSGKTTLLSLISRLVPRPVPAASITPAALFRTLAVFRRGIRTPFSG